MIAASTQVQRSGREEREDGRAGNDRDRRESASQIMPVMPMLFGSGGGAPVGRRRRRPVPMTVGNDAGDPPCSR